MLTKEQVYDVLREIPDPELPTINLVDLGVIHEVRVDEKICVEMLPTFVGCPALEVMQTEVRNRLAPFGEVEVKVVFNEAWTTGHITKEGREMLKEAGLAPPPESDIIALPLHQPAPPCPYCGSSYTRQESMFGPTPCRALYYCHACRQPFEGFKAV